ncbi:hypothetical protein SVIOM342S_08516 [Streptomyces violaceorubidus]
MTGHGKQSDPKDPSEPSDPAGVPDPADVPDLTDVPGLTDVLPGLTDPSDLTGRSPSAVPHPRAEPAPTEADASRTADPSEAADARVAEGAASPARVVGYGPGPGAGPAPAAHTRTQRAGTAPAEYAPAHPAPTGDPDGALGTASGADQGTPRHGDTHAVAPQHRLTFRLVPGAPERADAAGVRGHTGTSPSRLPERPAHSCRAPPPAALGRRSPHTAAVAAAGLPAGPRHPLTVRTPRASGTHGRTPRARLPRSSTPVPAPPSGAPGTPAGVPRTGPGTGIPWPRSPRQARTPRGAGPGRPKAVGLRPAEPRGPGGPVPIGVGTGTARAPAYRTRAAAGEPTGLTGSTPAR